MKGSLLGAAAGECRLTGRAPGDALVCAAAGARDTAGMVKARCTALPAEIARRSAPHTLTPAEQPATPGCSPAAVQTGFLKRKRGGKKMTGVDNLVRTSSA